MSAPDATAIVVALGPAIGAHRCALIEHDPDGGPRVIQPVLEAGSPVSRHLAAGTWWDGLAEGLGWPDAEMVPLDSAGTRVGAMIVEGPTLDRRVLIAVTPIAAQLMAALRNGRDAQAQAQRALHSAKLRTDLVSVVSHELRSPLTTIIGALQSLGRLAPMPEGSAAEKIVASALIRADRLHTLVDDLLVAIRPDRARRLPRSRPIDLGTLVDEAVDAVEGARGAVTIDLPQPAVTATLDADRVHRILVNLIDNALRHGSDEVRVSARTRGDWIEIQISDRGDGLNADIAAALAAPAEDDILEPVGSGLGLTITRGLVDAVDGTLGYSETPGGGATFTVLIPPGAAADAVV